MALSARGVWWPVVGDLPATTGFVTAISPLVAATGPSGVSNGASLRIVLPRSSPARRLAPHQDAKPVLDSLEARLSMTSEPKQPPFDNEMKGSSCTITHITHREGRSRCPTTATTNSRFPTTTPRVSAPSPRTPLSSTRMCNKLPDVNR